MRLEPCGGITRHADAVLRLPRYIGVLRARRENGMVYSPMGVAAFCTDPLRLGTISHRTAVPACTTSLYEPPSVTIAGVVNSSRNCVGVCLRR